MHDPQRVLDELLVIRAQDGDRAAAEALIRRWHGVLLAHARRLTGDTHDARDATQEAWVSVMRGLRRLDDPSLFGAWALRIVARRCADLIRARQRGRRRRSGDRARGERPAPGPAPVDDRETLSVLPTEDRWLLALHYVHGVSIAQIAELLGIPGGTVKSRLFAARERARKLLKGADE